MALLHQVDHRRFNVVKVESGFWLCGAITKIGNLIKGECLWRVELKEPVIYL